MDQPQHSDIVLYASQDLSTGLQCPACSRTFSQSSGAYSNHVRSCRPQKKRLASSLDLAKEKYQKKKARLDEPEIIIQPQIPGPDLETMDSSQTITVVRVFAFLPYFELFS